MPNDLNLSTIAVDQRLAIRKLLSSDYGAYKFALQDGCHWPTGTVKFNDVVQPFIHKSAVLNKFVQF